MTIQASELIEYRGEQYTLNSYPLYYFLKTRNDISFEMYSTAHWRGYQGRWKLEDNKLYLSSIESSNYSFFSIFNTNDPVLAEWYSGTLMIGLGERNYTEWSTYYENYLWLQVKDGVVVERKIAKQVPNDFIIDFGKFKGRTIAEILKGKIDTNPNIEKLCKNYIEEVISFLTNKEYDKKVNVPYFNISDETKAVVEDLKNSSIVYLLTSNFIAIEKHYLNDPEEELTEKFSKLLEEVLTSDFKVNRLLIKSKFSDGEISESTYLLNPDLNYLDWAMTKVSSFCIPPHLIEKAKEIKILKCFDIRRLNSTIFEYEPIIENLTFSFNQATRQNNLLKFEKKFEVTYDIINNIYVYDLSNEELFEKFGYYLDEYFEQVENTIDEFDGSDDEEHNYNDSERDYFDTMTDGQIGDYDDFIDQGGNIDDIDTWARG